ncbi:Protein transport protein [Podosphaera aphanis]|nr:Protein transport protein [Podosphaera aphanis]
MVRLRTIGRTGAFAWNPDSSAPLLVTGTRTGAVDADFSDETKLELWALHLEDPNQAVELQPIATLSTDSRFYDIAWSAPSIDHPRGIIAGALENSSLYLWDAEKLLNSEDESLISRTKKHTGSIKALQFNSLKPQILATVGTKGEIFIYDINDIENPFRLGSAATQPDDLECVAWNMKVPHILATGGTGGSVTVWDLKTKKPSLTLNNNRRPVGAIAWDPENSTKLITATPDDTCPVIYLWDLRNANAPECTLQGHHHGVLSISWCRQDDNLLISCGKDNRTLLWNPKSGELLGEFPEASNWNFQTRFHPYNPDLSATASFDGKISIQTLQNTNISQNMPQVQNAVDGEDFFAKVQSQPPVASFSLKTAPKWLERPCGASFGFGGKLVNFSRTPTTVGSQRSSKIQISHYAIDDKFESAAIAFEKALESGDIKSICQNSISQAKLEQEKSGWEVIETLLLDNPRKKLIEYLGYTDFESGSDALLELNDEKAAPTIETLNDNTADGSKSAHSSRLSTIFAEGADSEDFLSNLSNLSNISATESIKVDNPFQILSDSDSDSEKGITKALILGQFERAMKICFEEDRITDALIIANCGGKDLFEKAQSLYLSKKSDAPNYLKLLSSIIGKNLWDVVSNADLKNWKETMVTLCTYADPKEFSDLCESLGDRLTEQNLSRDASFCYLVGSKLEKIIPIWLCELQEIEKAGIKDLNGNSLFSVHALSLQNFIEKVTVFRRVTKYKDMELKSTSDWKLGPLYAKYIEYTEIIAAHGHLKTAEKYLDLLPESYPAAEVARNRVKLISRKGESEIKTNPSQPNLSRSQTRPQPLSNYPPMNVPVNTLARPPSNPYTPTNTSVANLARPPTNSYAQPTSVYGGNMYSSMTNSYAPQQQNFQPPQQNPYGPGGYNSNYAAPPPAFGSNPSYMAPPPKPVSPTPPPPRTKEQWNDTPLVVKPPVARRNTPSVAPITAPFQSQQPSYSMPPSLPYGNRAVATPPPPKASAPPTSAPSPASGYQHIQQNFPPASQHTAQTMPSSQQFSQKISQTNQYGSSSYNPQPTGPPSGPPLGPPPSNRYAPPPSTSQYSVGNQPPQPSAPQYLSGTQAPPPSTPQYPLGTQAPPPSAPQYPLGNQLPTLSSQPGAEASARPIKTEIPTPTKTRHPVGDRTHIPPTAQRMVEIFSSDMQRVALQAPSSFTPQVKDTQKRLNILFDHLNNEELVKQDTIQRLNELAEALSSRNYSMATKLQVDIQKERTEECGSWMVGVKRLISMSKATP